MSKIWQTIRGYIWWTHPRGNVHYDVMVTLILLFIFVTPRWVFNDKPTERVPHQSGVLVVPEGQSLVYTIEASAVRSTTDASIKDELLRVIEPISGEAEIDRYQAVNDERGKTKSYKVWVKRPYR